MGNIATNTSLETIIKEMTCPYCFPGSADLTAEISYHISNHKRIPFVKYKYKCSFCKDTFTTDESDELSLENYYKELKESKHEDNKD